MDAPFPPGMVEEIEAFLERYKDLPDGKSLYPEVFETSLFFPLQRKKEMEFMLARARAARPRVAFEIGADKGAGVFSWVKTLGRTLEKMIVAEIRGTPYAKAFERAFPYIDFLFLEESSYSPKTVEKVKEFLGTDPIDVLFLDGDKSAFDRDFDAYYPLVRTGGGVIFIHDITDREGPFSVFERARYDLGLRVREFVDRSDADEALKREAAGIPPANAHEGWLRYWRGRSCGVGVVEL